ncbi:unnamed protein product [Parajaminaea phylloscopi]
MTAVRPKLQARAISEMGPLVNPARDTAKADLGQGTRAAVGGNKVASGSRLPGGALAPLSPFLPLPPAPTSAELAAHQSEDAVLTPKALERQAHKPKSAWPPHRSSKGGLNKPGATGMMRSYSTPVATHKQYEEQCQAFAERQAMAATTAATARTFPWSSGWPTATPSYADHHRHQSQQRRHASASASAMAPSKSQHSWTPQQQSNAKPKRMPLSPLALNLTPTSSQQDASDADAADSDIEYLATGAETNAFDSQGYDDHYFAPRKFHECSDNSSESCSEGPATPKAVTPTHVHSFGSQYHGLGSRQHDDLREDIKADHLDELIHPDHLCPPPAKDCILD